MRLVIEFSAGDGCTWWATVSVPVVYESAEAFAVDFEEACLKAKSSAEYTFKFAGYDWEPGDFIIDGDYFPPDILTVDEWFARHVR